MSATKASLAGRQRHREGDIWGFQVEEVLHMPAGWQTLLFWTVALWHVFYHCGFHAGSPHLTWGCMWPAKHSWCVCLCSSCRLMPLCIGSTAQFSKKQQSFNRLLRRVKTMDAWWWLCLAISELAGNKIILMLFLDVFFLCFWHCTFLLDNRF